MCTQSVVTSLETSGESSAQPFPTSTRSGTIGTFYSIESISLPTGGSQYEGVASKAAMAVSDIFQPIATGSPPSQITARGDHPVPKLGIVSRSFSIIASFGLQYVGIGISDVPDFDEQVLREPVPRHARSGDMDPPVFSSLVQGNWKCRKLGDEHLPHRRKPTSVRAAANDHTWFSRTVLHQSDRDPINNIISR